MIQVIRDIITYHELLLVLAWKNITVRYKQAYLGLIWTVLKPLMLVLIFSVVRSFVGIETGPIPYAVLTFGALLPWMYFQESVSEGIQSVVSNSALVRKIYFPRIIFPLTPVLTRMVEFVINLLVLAGLMAYYRFVPSIHVLWIPLIIAYLIIVSLCVSLAGAALNVYYRDVASGMQVILSLFMYLSPVIYPISLVKRTLLINRAVGEWSDALFTVYTLNPIVGIIDSFQKVMFYSEPPDLNIISPGLLLVCAVLPLSYTIFKRAESYFADVI